MYIHGSCRNSGLDLEHDSKTTSEEGSGAGGDKRNGQHGEYLDELSISEK